MRSYFYAGGIKNRYISSSSTSSNSSSTSTTSTDEINKYIRSLELQIATTQAQLNQLLGINNKLTSLTSRVEILEGNEINIFNINDPSGRFSNVYNTTYINETFRSRTINFSDDINESQLSQYPYVPTLNAILNIRNINNIPTLSKVFIPTSSATSSTSAYTASLCNSYFTKIPVVLDTNQQQITTNYPEVYSKFYIDSILPSIKSEKDTSPAQNNIYNTTYINSILTNLPDIKHRLIVDASGSNNVYSCYYINGLAIPNDILFNSDTHISTSTSSDTSEKNVYDTYYLDQWLHPSSDSVVGKTSNELRLKYFPTSQRGVELIDENTNQYQQSFGANMEEIILRPSANQLTIATASTTSATNNNENEIKLMSINKLPNSSPLLNSSTTTSASTSNAILNIKSLNIGDGSNALYENYYSQELFDDFSDVRYVPMVSALDLINPTASTSYTKKILFGMTKGAVGSSIVSGGIEPAYNFSVITNHTDIYNSENTYLSFGFNNPIPNNSNVDNENILQIRPGKVICNGDLTVYGEEALSSNLTVHGTTSLSGALTAYDNATISKALTVYGETALSSTLTVYDATTISAPLTVYGDSTLAGVNVAGNLNVAGTTTLSSDAIVKGDLVVKGLITQSSDRRLKKDIRPLEDEVDLISKLNPVSFTMDEEERFGFIAQDVENVEPKLVHKSEDSEYLSVNYIEIIPFLVKELQNQKKRITALEDENRKLREVISELVK